MAAELEEPFLRFGRSAGSVKLQSTLVTERACADYAAFQAKLEAAHGAQRSVAVRQLWVATEAWDLTASESSTLAIGGGAVTDSEFLEDVREALNRSHRRLLAWLFEDYLRCVAYMYAGLGFLDNATWKDKDLQALPDRSHAAFVAMARKKAHNGAGSVLGELRRALVDLGTFEASNWTGLDVAFWLAVVEQLRHVIVHCEGSQPSSEFWEGMERKTGKKMTGSNSDSEYRQSSEAFVQESDGEAKVAMLERRAPLQVGGNITKPFYSLYRIATSHAALVYKLSMQHLGGQAIWERPKET